jgi:hypothetical protein
MFEIIALTAAASVFIVPLSVARQIAQARQHRKDMCLRQSRKQPLAGVSFAHLVQTLHPTH